MTEIAERRTPQLRRFGCFGGLVLATSTAVCGFCFTTCNPPDRVDVTFQHVPADTTRIGIIADTDGTAELMLQYLVPPLAPFGITNAGGGIEWEWQPPDNAAAPPKVYHVAWVRGARYGVVTKGGDGVWTVTRFDTKDVPIQGRWPLIGGGHVELDLARGQAEALPEQRAKKLGLDFEGRMVDR